MALFRTLGKKVLPGWLSEGEGELVDYSLGAVKDAFAARMYEGVRVRFPQHAPSDALAYIERDRGIVRGIDESESAFAARLIEWRTKRSVQGNPFALLEQIQKYINAPVRVRTVDQRSNWYTREFDGTESALVAQSNWNWDGTALTLFSRFWVVIYPAGATDPWAVTPGTLAGGPWSNNLGDKSITLGITGETEHIAKIRTIIRKWQPDGTRCEWIIFAFNSGSFDPAAISEPLPNPGTWGKWGKLSGSDYVVARSATHRYARGVQGSTYP